MSHLSLIGDAEEKWVKQEHIARMSSLSFLSSSFFFDEFLGCYVNYDKAKGEGEKKGEQKRNKKKKKNGDPR